MCQTLHRPDLAQARNAHHPDGSHELRTGHGLGTPLRQSTHGLESMCGSRDVRMAVRQSTVVGHRSCDHHPRGEFSVLTIRNPSTRVALQVIYFDRSPPYEEPKHMHDQRLSHLKIISRSVGETPHSVSGSMVWRGSVYVAR